MNTKRSLLVILLLIHFSSYGQQAVLDSLSSLLADKMLKETARIDILNEIASQLKASDPARSIARAHDALEASRKIDYKNGEGHAHVIIGDNYWIRSEYEKSLGRGLSSLRIFETSGDKKGLMASYFLLGLNYSSLNDTLKSDLYFDKALLLAHELNHKEWLARIYNTLGRFTTEVDNKAGLAIYLKGFGYVQNNDRSVQKAFLMANIGGNYETMGEIDKALDWLNRSLQLSRVQDNKFGEANAHLQLGDIYKKLKEFSMSEEHYLRSEQLARHLGARRMLQNSYISHIELKLMMDDNKGAHEFQKKYAWVRDSVFNAERAQRIAEMETRYATAEKENTIKLLEQEKNIQQIWQNVLIGGTLLIAIASLFIVRLQRSRSEKTKQLLEVQHLLNNKLTEVDKLKSRFFANISHEFRTPLTLIMAPLEGELKKRSQDEDKEPLLLMKRNANRLLELVNQLLDLSRLESGRMELKVKPGSIQSFLKVIAASFDSWAQHKGITFVKNIQLNEKALWFDRDKVEKIITNLLANAFKFTPSNCTVNFTVACKETGSRKVLSIIISDTGRGIPEEEQEQVFLPFYQTRQSIESHQGGTGLGLSLVKELVKLYGGVIVLESKTGMGSTFSVELPADRNSFSAEQVDETDAAEWSPENARTVLKEDIYNELDAENENDSHTPQKDTIIIVEDNADLRNYMSSILEDEFIVLTARDGEEAMRLTLRVIPNLVLSDLMMPKMDGIQLTEKIKTDQRTSHIPIILLTAKNEPESRLHGLKTGADDYLTKPFSTEELRVRITNLIDQRKLLTERFRERILVHATPTSESSLDDKFLYRVQEIVESNLSDFSFTVERMADEINLSRTQLLRKLKALTGLSPNEFIKDLRLKRAANMIRQKTDTITQIGYAVGFNDQSYFTKCFKKQFGVTPTEFSMQVVKG